MADLKTMWEPGKMRQGHDIFTCPPPDKNDPHWRRRDDNQWEWRSRYIRREDWSTTKFYPSTVRFQKHLDREARMLDLSTGANITPNRSTLENIEPVVRYEFVNTSKSSRAPQQRRLDMRANARGQSRDF
jgi:hypothetical protein